MDDLARSRGEQDIRQRRWPILSASSIARMLRFALVGVAATLLYAVIAFALAYVSMLPAAVTSLIAYCTAGVLSYFGHRLFTFKAGGGHARPAARFVGINLLGYAVAAVIPWVLSDRLGYPAAIGIVLVCIVIPAMNYVLFNLFVFREPVADARHAR